MIQGRFKILETLSKRNSVQTYKCQDGELGIIVLKVFESVSEKQTSQLRHFSESLLRLSHPGLQKHLGIFEDGPQAALAFSWIEGVTLAQEITQGVRYPDEALFRFLGESLEALAVAHSLEPALIHRDIKPENVVRTSEGWVLIDFGASREAILGDGEVSVIGTTGYAAPEQFFGQALPASDQYGLAATTLHLATHRHPTDFPLRKLKLEIEDAGLSRALQKVLDRMLSPDPKERFRNVQIALEAVTSRAGMEEWEFALEPIVDTETVLNTKVNGAELEIAIDARSNKIYLYLSLITPFALVVIMASFLVLKGKDPSLAFLMLGMTALPLGFLLLPIIRREWLGSYVWLLRLSPNGFQLERNGKLVDEGTRPHEVVSSGGLLLQMDRSLHRRSPGQLRTAEGMSKAFGHSMNANELEVLQAVVESFYREPRSESTKVARAETHALMARATDFLQAQPRPLFRRYFSSLMQFTRVLPETPKRLTYFQRLPQSARAEFEKYRFKKVGYIKETILGITGAPQQEVYFDEDGVVALHVGPGVLGESESDFTYYLSTLMDDGNCRLTWSHKNPKTQSDGLLASAASKGSFERDFAAHTAWITEMSENRGSMPVRMTSMEDRIAALKFHALHTESVSTSMTVFFMAFGILSIPLMIIQIIVLSI